MVTPAEVMLLAATAVHLGFQATVTTMVYPALFASPDWADAHRRHSRAITPVVAVVYGALVAAATWVLVSGALTAWTVVSLLGVALSLATTAVVAAPLHGRLARGRDAGLIRRLTWADLVRTTGALVAFGASFAGTVGHV